MIKIFLATALYFVSGIHNIQITTADNQAVSLGNYAGKKMLLVNIATGSDYVDQLNGLKQLQQQFMDSLVIIAFPSNSFGNESRSNSEVSQFCVSNYSTNFLIAAKADVLGANVQPVFHWLAHVSENGALDAPAVSDFQKFLIDKDGSLMGVFSSVVQPTDSSIINAITTN